ncbi:NlpC/P60 family protein [Streptomyces sp. NPDC050523]|uniref:NlpC/P60 family protein n=1 Tax=Streptomyces sp. NPDC050523 TaxID=3365622 RepID=UPI0037BC2561
MAPERSSRPGGLGPGMRNSALATAALTSVALFSQTADAAPKAADEGPSREDVRQRVSSLYDRAESDTGLHNITRAQSVHRGRGAAAGGGRSSDPDLDNIARQWFQGARSSLGPTVPATLPTDRMPAQRTASPRPSRPERPAEPRAGAARELEAPARPVLELPAAEPRRRPVAELTAGPTAALPAVPAQRQETAAQPAAQSEPRQVVLRRSKQANQRKIAAASDLLYRYTARQTSVAPLTAAQPQALPTWQDPAEQTHRAAEEAWRLQQPSVLDTGVPAAEDWRTRQPTVLDTGISTADEAWRMQQPTVLDTGIPTADETWRMQQPTVLDTGIPTASETWRMQQPTVLDTGIPTASETWRMQQPTVLDTGMSLADEAWRTRLQQPSVLDTGVPAAEDWRTRQPTVLDTGISTADEAWRMQQPTVLDTGIPAVETPVGTKADRAVAFARAQIGRPCLWGAVGPESYDNAGLTQAAWKAAGVALPRSTSEQARTGTVIPLAESRPGDLIFFHDNFSHVGLYTGNGMMIHAPGPGSVIREESIHNAGEAAIRIAVRPA